MLKIFNKKVFIMDRCEIIVDDEIENVTINAPFVMTSGTKLHIQKPDGAGINLNGPHVTGGGNNKIQKGGAGDTITIDGGLILDGGSTGKTFYTQNII